MPITSGPPDSARLATISVAYRPPFGTVIVWRSWFAGLLPSTRGIVVVIDGETVVIFDAIEIVRATLLQVIVNSRGVYTPSSGIVIRK